MSYILDQKKTIGSYVTPTGSSNKITVFSEFDVIPVGSTISQFGVYNDGTLQIGDSDNTTYNNLKINAGINFQFKQVTDTGTDYLMTNNDFSIEIISGTYNTVTLPSALNTGGRTYIISRRSVNNNLIVQAQPGETIDDRLSIALKRTGDHIRVQSNNLNAFYIV